MSAPRGAGGAAGLAAGAGAAAAASTTAPDDARAATGARRTRSVTVDARSAALSPRHSERAQPRPAGLRAASGAHARAGFATSARAAAGRQLACKRSTGAIAAGSRFTRPAGWKPPGMLNIFT